MAKRCVPPIGDWSTYAAGTGCPDGAHGYSAHPSVGNYKINPRCPSSVGRRQQSGYRLIFENVRGRSKHGGLNQDIGVFRRASSAAVAANKHCLLVESGLAGASRRRRRR